MDLIEVPVHEYIRLTKQLARDQGFLAVIYICALDIDVPGLYEGIAEYWQSFDISSGPLFLFALAGKQSEQRTPLRGANGMGIIAGSIALSQGLTVPKEYEQGSAFKRGGRRISPGDLIFDQNAAALSLASELGVTRDKMPCLVIESLVSGNRRVQGIAGYDAQKLHFFLKPIFDRCSALVSERVQEIRRQHVRDLAADARPSPIDDHRPILESEQVRAIIQDALDPRANGELLNLQVDDVLMGRVRDVKSSLPSSVISDPQLPARFDAPTLLQKEFSPAKNPAWSDLPIIVHRHEAPTERSLVVLVHGLSGERYNYWGKMPGFLLEDFPDIALAMVGYRTAQRRLAFWKSVPFDDHAEIISGELVPLMNSFDRTLFITHSLGGLITMASLNLVAEQNAIDAERALDSVGALVLADVPLLGSWIATVGLAILVAFQHSTLGIFGVASIELVLLVLSYLLLPDVRALRIHSKEQARILNNWKKNFTADPEGVHLVRKIKIYGARAAIGGVVDRLSSTMGIPAQNLRTFAAPHSGLVRPVFKEDRFYTWICSIVKDRLGPGSAGAAPVPLPRREESTDLRAALAKQHDAIRDALKWDIGIAGQVAAAIAESDANIAEGFFERPFRSDWPPPRSHYHDFKSMAVPALLKISTFLRQDVALARADQRLDSSATTLNDLVVRYADLALPRVPAIGILLKLPRSEEIFYDSEDDRESDLIYFVSHLGKVEVVAREFETDLRSLGTSVKYRQALSTLAKRIQDAANEHISICAFLVDRIETYSLAAP